MYTFLCLNQGKFSQDFKVAIDKVPLSKEDFSRQRNNININGSDQLGFRSMESWRQTVENDGSVRWRITGIWKMECSTVGWLARVDPTWEIRSQLDEDRRQGRAEQPSTPEDERDQEQVVPLAEGLKTPDHMARRLSPKKGGKKHGPVAQPHPQFVYIYRCNMH